MTTHRKTEEVEAKAHGVWWWLSHAVSWVLLIFVTGILLAAIVVPKIGGAMPYTVLTVSMEPTYPRAL